MKQGVKFEDWRIELKREEQQKGSKSWQTEAIFTSAINRFPIQHTMVGKFDLQWPINNTAETCFNYLENNTCPWRGHRLLRRLSTKWFYNSYNLLSTDDISFMVVPFLKSYDKKKKKKKKISRQLRYFSNFQKQKFESTIVFKIIKRRREFENELKLRISIIYIYF